MKTDQDYLRDIHECIDHIRDYVGGLKFETFESTVQIQDAVLRRLEIIGEAANRLSPEFQARHSEIPWRTIVDLRNVLIHQYMGAKLDRVWEIIRKRLPELRRVINEMNNQQP